MSLHESNPFSDGPWSQQRFLEAHNVERVRSFLEQNLGCSKKEVVHALKLSGATVAKAIKIIRGKA